MTTTNIITYLDQITTEWLISVLTQSETLTCGTVQAFTFDIEQGNWSTSVNLTTTYTDNAQETLPLTPLPQNGGYWYGLKMGFRGRFGMYIPPLMEALGLAEVEHNPRNNRMRAK